MLYGERAYAGPDIYDRTFDAEPCQHCETWQDTTRLTRIEELHRSLSQRSLHRARPAQ